MIGITIHEFGHRLGNQLFQLAAITALAKENNDIVAFPEWDYAQYFDGDFTPVDFNPNLQFKEYGVFEGTGFGYSPIPYTKGMSIYGYFQSEKYFIHQEDTIRDMFHPALNIVEKIWKKFYREYSTETRPTCAVHVRRGDYAKWPNHHPMLPAEWYWDAIETFKEDTHFLIFSDDTKWCKKNIKEAIEHFQGTYECYESYKITVVEGQTDIEDFFMQQLCDSNIIANSSYSWWAAWLNKRSKRVIAPKQWFGSALSEYNMGDLIPDSWEVV